MSLSHVWSALRLGAVFCLTAIAIGCGQTTTESADVQGWLPWQPPEPLKILKTESGDYIPERVANFLKAAESFGRGVHTYRLGSYARSVTDCSGYLAQAHRASGYRVALNQFDWDVLNFAGCTGQLRAGDVLLLAYPGRAPDHWIMMADVRDPRGKFNFGENIIMDVSSDYVDGKPFFKGPLNRRRNLLARQVYACRRHRSFEKDWKQIATQLQEQKRQAELEKEKTPETPVTPEHPTTDPVVPVQEQEPTEGGEAQPTRRGRMRSEL